MKGNKHIPSSFEIKLYGELTPYELNPSMSKCRVATFRKYGNNNGSYFTDEISEIMVQNAPGSPIVGKFDAEKEDFTSHLTVKDTKAYGFIPPENPNFAWEKRVENDGVEYEYACFDVVLWTDRYKEAKLIPFKNESMELNPSSITGDWKTIDGETYFVYDSANIYGLCVLGDTVAPCFDAACFYEKDSIQTYMDTLREEIKNNFSLMTQSKEEKENQGGKEEMDYKINLPQVDNFQLLFEALNPDVDENSNRNLVNAIYDIQNDFALYHSYSDGKNYQVNYSINDGAITLDEAKEIAVFMNIVDENEVNAYNDIMGEEHSFASIQSHIADLNNTISEQQTTIDNFNANDYPAKIAELEQRISAYEAAENKAISEQKDALIESYSEDVDGEVLDDVKANKDNYSLADIENKLAVNFARKQRANNGGKVPHVNEDEDPVLAVLNKYKAMKGEKLMAIQRYKTEKFATIELNHVSWPETARVFAQLPLDTTDFSNEAPCENGMWVVYDYAGGTVRKAKTADENVGIMYLNEKEYNPYISGMNQWALKPNTVNPRVGMPAVGDLYTTNCFCYDTTEFTDDEAVDTALAAYATTPVYLVVAAGQGAPKLTKTKAGKVVAQVVKDYTMPNGEHGIKVMFISC